MTKLTMMGYAMMTTLGIMLLIIIGIMFHTQ